MPELPDVEHFRRVIDEHATGQRVEEVTAPDPSIVRNTTPSGLGRALNGRRLTSPERHGKWVFLATEDGPTVLLHFGMTGYPTWASDGGDRGPHDHLILVCEDGELRINMQRKFGGVWLVQSGDDTEQVTGPLGPDAADLSRDDLATLLDGRRGGLKSALMDQELTAGVGNIVADEVLWRARLDPERGASDLEEDELDALHAALAEVLEVSTEHGQVPRDPDWLTSARDVDEPSCPRCATTIENTEVAGRTTYRCPSCQS